MKTEHEEVINNFQKRLLELNRNEEVEILYRGISKKGAFEVFKLNTEYNNIQQYAEKLFFFGNKAIHFVKTTTSKKFNIDDISDESFSFIFNEFYKLRKSKNNRTIKFIENNQKQFDYFFNKKNKTDFIKKIRNQRKNETINSRNYLFSILHQVGNFTKYKKKSHFVSSTSLKEVASEFAKGGIIIKFWKLNKMKNKYKGIFLFNSFVYPEQKEDSVYTAIFPHYILSFIYDGKEYFNPYIKKCHEVDNCIYTGFDIIQDDFKSRLKYESIYEMYVEFDGENYIQVEES